MMILTQGYRQAHDAAKAKPNLDYPNLSVPDIDEDSLDYPLWEQLLEEDIQGIFDRRLEYE